MAEIRLVVTDLDGTFLSGWDSVPEENVRAVQECEAAGIPVRCITARGYHFAKRPLALGGFQGLCVTSNGNGVHDVETGQALFSRTIPKQTLVRLLDICARAHVHMGLNTAQKALFCKPLFDWRLWHDDEKEMQAWPEKDRHYTVMADTVEQMADWAGDATQVLWMQSRTEEELPGWLYRAIVCEGEFLLSSSHPGGLDVMPAGSGKREGLIWLANHMGIQRENIMAIGDLFNDIGMLQWAGLGVAMGNGDAKVKATADVVTGSNTEAGVAQAIDRYVLHKG